VTEPAAVYSVYRRRNAAVLERLLAPALARNWTVGLWALDKPHSRLADFTAGSGPGMKFDLVNRLLEDTRPNPTQPVVVADDDAEFVRGDVASFLENMAAARLDLAQPAHVLRSNISHRITWRRPLSRARLTTFVEIGPLFAVTPEWRDRIMPFPQEIGMGWGLELDWMDLRADGCRLGIVDRTPIRHLSPFAAAYAPEDEIAKLTRLLDERGAPGWRGLRRTLGTWRPWQRRPPWG
jgi:hypothetical protein